MGYGNNNNNIVNTIREPVGDFYVHLVKGPRPDYVDRDLTSTTALLKRIGQPTVIHFYDSGWGGCRPCAAQMKKWSLDRRFRGSVRFLCVCVESAQVAMMFHQMFDFGKVDINDDSLSLVNGYIPSRPYMPVGYGQLGCSGFVISDADGNFVSRKTAAYLQYGESAFRHVESLLQDLIPSQSPSTQKNKKKNDVVPPTNVVMDREEKDKNKKRKNCDGTKNKAAKSSSSSSPTSTMTMMQPPESVGVDAMDDEHKICTDSFNRAMKDPTFENLEELHDILKCHFDHEEELIEKYSSSSSSSTFSALNSHRLDHQRILKIATTELERITNKNGSANGDGGATVLPIDRSCSVEQGVKVWHRPAVKKIISSPSPKTRVDEQVIDDLIEAFHIHAETFDALYHASIPADAE